MEKEIKQFKRNELGLVEGIEYKYTPEGMIDWRAMINPKYLVINKQYEDSLVKRFLKPLNEIKVTEVEDNKLLILLQGIKEIANLRGYRSVKPSLDYVSESKAVVTTKIEWIGNFETSNLPVVFGDVGSASLDNTSGFGQMYLEAIAANRAFVRTVRNFLCINVLANDEIDAKATQDFLTKKKSEYGQHTPQAVLERLLTTNGLSINSLKEKAIVAEAKITSDPTTWTDIGSIPQKDVLVLISLLKK